SQSDDLPVLEETSQTDELRIHEVTVQSDELRVLEETSQNDELPTSEETRECSLMINEETSDLSYEDFQVKASSLAEKGIYLVAARLYEESAYRAPDSSLSTAALMNAIDCYVKAEHLIDAKSIASELHHETDMLSELDAMKVTTVLRMPI
ncbi:MAG: hypothetical protein LUD41_02605, partial [Phascolarctobacterium sp.]|nr:hypothetical protein [Phascolarctobacterium sp.]